MTDEKLMSICMEIYKKMYKETKPVADLDKLMKSGKTKEKTWYLKYYLSEERQQEIVKEVIKSYGRKLDKWDKVKINNEIWLGASPTSVKKGRNK